MKKVIVVSVLSIFLAFNFELYAQTDSSAINIKAGVFYNSKLHYYGRTDSVSTAGLIPSLEAWFANRFYINFSPVFTNNQLEGFTYAGSVATAGWMVNNGKSIRHIYLVKPLYKEEARLVQSALKAQLSGSFTKLNKVINLTAGADVKWSSEIDFGMTAGLDHIFKKGLPGNLWLVIDPTATVNAGTQRFTQTYKSNAGLPLLSPLDAEQSEHLRRFSLLSYELSMPIILAKQKWLIIVNPSYVIPKNLLGESENSGQPEYGKNLFTITAGARINF